MRLTLLRSFEASTERIRILTHRKGTRHRTWACTWARESSDQSYSNRVDGRLLGSARADRRGGIFCPALGGRGGAVLLRLVALFRWL